MKICDNLQERLAESGADLLSDDAEAREHLAGCADCAKVLADLERLDATLGDLPTPDAPDALVASTLAAVRREARPSGRSGGNWRIASRALAACVVVVASLIVVRSYLTSSDGYLAFQKPALLTEAEPESLVTSGEIVDRRLSAQRGAEVSLDQLKEADPDHGEFRRDRRSNETAALAKQEAAPPPALTETLAPRWALREDEAQFGEESRLIARLQARSGADQRASGRASGPAVERSESFNDGSESSFSGAKSKADGGYGERDDYRANEPAGTSDRAKKSYETGILGGAVSGPDNQPVTRNETPEEEAGFRDSLRSERNRALEGQDQGRAGGAGTSHYDGISYYGDEVSGLTSGLEAQDQTRLLARSFLEQIGDADSLAFQEPRGYWANSYVPGDPAMRLLRMRLKDWDRSALGPDFRLEQGVRRVGQPFDAPGEGALALYLHADRAAVEGPSRLRLQVGLQGAERQGGHRPAMNLGLVVDAASLTSADLTGDDAGRRVRALIAALERARQPGDRFSLTVSGPGGGLVVEPEDFRHGPLTIALDRLFATTGTDAASMDLVQAVSLAAESVRKGDDPNAVLGSSLVLLATGSSLAGELVTLERLAHENAVGGVPLSVVGLGTGADPAEIDRLVAAGQGNRRILETAAAADALVDRELHAASRAVARAVRLRIRLAPGVRLIDVLDSHRLDAPQAERVREAEQSIDRRLARNLGIEADRGEDEDGIQIVIPTFYAGDAHVILLDLVAEGPGPVAEVQVRYKDVTRLDNGMVEAALALGDGERTAGPLERNVLKNLVAWLFAREVRRAGRMLESGDRASAKLLLKRQWGLIRGLRLEVPGWSEDPDLAADLAMLKEYLAALAGSAARQPEQRRYLAQSLRYAAFSKLQNAAR